MLTKEEIANIKRIDTSLNVFKRKIVAIDSKIKKLTEPLVEEQKNLKAEIDFWERPVIERYGKTTEELLREVGEETSEDVSTDEEKEVVSEPEPVNDTPVENETPAPAETDEDSLGYEDMPEEWK